MNKLGSGSNFLIITLTIIAILLIIYIFLYMKKYKTEHFDNKSLLEMSLQTGMSGITSTGTIIFTTPFLKPPMIFTQIIGNTNTALNMYSVQIFNVTNTGFNYSKNEIAVDLTSEYDVVHVSKSSLESFNWVAFG